MLKLQGARFPQKIVSTFFNFHLECEPPSPPLWMEYKFSKQIVNKRNFTRMIGMHELLLLMTLFCVAASENHKVSLRLYKLTRLLPSFPVNRRHSIHGTTFLYNAPATTFDSSTNAEAEWQRQEQKISQQARMCGSSHRETIRRQSSS